MSLLYSDERMDKAIAFCWDTQRMLTRARFEAWSPERSMMHFKSRQQLWRRFPSGVRTSAHAAFMEQLDAELRKPKNERSANKPVWLNEQLGWTGDGEPNAAGLSGAAATP